MSSLIQDAARYLVTSSLAWASRNPLEALGATAIISNPTTRKLTFQIGGHLAKQNLRDLQFFSRLIYTEIVVPAGQAALPRIKSAATTPAVAIPATALAVAAVGATISSATVVKINETHNIGSSSPFAMWSPFGGFGFGTVV